MHHTASAPPPSGSRLTLVPPCRATAHRPLPQASTSVRHLLLPCHWSQRATVVPDLVKFYGVCGRTIIFTETKNDANELASTLGENMTARALHGDIPQRQREVRGRAGSRAGGRACARLWREGGAVLCACACACMGGQRGQL